MLLLAGVLWLGHGCATIIAAQARSVQVGPEYEFTGNDSLRPRVIAGVHVGVTDRDGAPVHWYEFQGALAGETRWLRIGIAAGPSTSLRSRAWGEEFTPPGGAGVRRPALLDLVGCRPQTDPPSATALGDPGGDPYPQVLRLRVCDSDTAVVQVAWGPDWTWYPVLFDAFYDRRSERNRRQAYWKKNAPMLDLGITGAVAATAAIYTCVRVCGGIKMGAAEPAILPVDR